jgi:hypothetical protein
MSLALPASKNVHDWIGGICQKQPFCLTPAIAQGSSKFDVLERLLSPLMIVFLLARVDIWSDPIANAIITMIRYLTCICLQDCQVLLGLQEKNEYLLSVMTKMDSYKTEGKLI